MSTKSIREISACALLLLVCAALLAAQTPAVNLQGIITDPSGAAVPGAILQLRGSDPEQRAATGAAAGLSCDGQEPGTIGDGTPVRQGERTPHPARILEPTRGARLDPPVPAQEVRPEEKRAQIW